jgi:peptide/nickel transport system substrate-binding protein
MGIKVRLRPVDWSVYQDIHKQRDYDAMTLGWGASAPESDPKQTLHSASIRNQGDNFLQWSNPDADRLIDEGRRTLDQDRRFGIWRQLERVLHEEQPYTFVRNPPWLRVVNPAVRNVNTYFKGLEHAEFFRAGPQSPTPGT